MNDKIEVFVDEDESQVAYGITMSYVKDWGVPDVVREIMSNAKDTGAKFNAYVDENGSFVIQDNGAGIDKKYFLVGESASRDKTDAIGEFAEGLKMAILVLTRMGKRVVVTTKNYKATNAIVVKFGEECLRMVMTDHEPVKGTKVVISDLPEASQYLDMFMFTKTPEELKELVVSGNDHGTITLDCKLYAKGVFCQNIDGYEFGYDSPYIKMNRDRKAVSEWDIQINVGKIWSAITEPEAWKVFFEAGMDGMYERNLYIHLYNQEVRKAFMTGWGLAFGFNAVIETDEDASREAKHRGAKPINIRTFGAYVIDLLFQNIQTDEEYVIAKRGIKAFAVSNSELTPTERKNLSALKRMGKKVGFNGNVIVARIPTAKGDATKTTIRINLDYIGDLEEAKEIMVHELAHSIYDTDDLTNAHVNACCKIGVALMK